MAELATSFTNANELFEPYQDLIAAEQQLIPDIEIDDTIRVKVLDKCGMTCNFCHNEGTPVTIQSGFQAHRVSIYTETNGMGFTQADIGEADVASFGNTLARLGEAGLAKEVHWTGGEPTLSKALPILTSAAREAGYGVKMTSNGQSGARNLDVLSAAGLQGVNFSIFGTTPEELAATQANLFRANLNLAKVRLGKMDEAMTAASELGLNVKANIVISGEKDIDRGLRLLENTPDSVRVRFQADTSSRQESLAAIYKLMSQIGGIPVSRELVAGCSIDNYDYEIPDGRQVTFKQTRFSRLSAACDGCEIDARGDCHEGYYGLRLYKDTEEKYWLSPCIQRMDTAQTLDTFLGYDGLGAKVKEHRDNEYAKLAAMHTLVA